MSAPDSKITDVLTEHLEFPPILLIDRIINAVNDVMYKCTESVENHLLAKAELLFPNRKRQDDNDETNLETEIELGITKLETLLENSIDKNFDKFELYCLRNILTIPNDLSSKGFFKLKHHEDLIFEKNTTTKSTALDLKINETYTDIKMQLYIKKVLIGQLVKIKRLVKLLRLYRDSLKFLNQKNPPNESISIVLNSLSPLNESLYYLLQQNIEFFDKIDSIKRLLKDNENMMNGSEKSIFIQRDVYLKVESIKLMKLLGLVKDKGSIEEFFTNLNDVDIDSLDTRKRLKSGKEMH